MTLLYIGPGLGVGTIVIIIIVLLIILASFVMILLTPLKNLYRKLTGKPSKGPEQEEDE